MWGGTGLAAIWLASNLILIFSGGWPALLAGAVLFAYLPGVLLLRVAPGVCPSTDRLAKVVLHAGLAFLISSLAMLVAHAMPGPLTHAQALVALNVVPAVLLAIAFRRRTDAAPDSPADMSWSDWAVLAALVVLIVALRFGSLGYSEYQGDEIDVTRLAGMTIAGQPDVLFLHRKGPVEVLTATAFALFGRDFNEFGLRFPFALASGFAMLGAYALGRRFFGPAIAAAGAALLAVNGIFLGFSRMVQYQGVVVLALVGAVLCFAHLRDRPGDNLRRPDSRFRVGLGVLGLALWGLALLTHYEAALIGAPLLVLLLHARPSRRDLIPLAGAGLAVATVLLAFYVPFALHPHFADTFRRYTEIRISLDRAPFHNLPDYLTSALFYNSVYYEALMFGGLLLAAWQGLHRALQRANIARLLWLMLAVGLAGSALVPSALEIAGLKIGLLLVAPALAVLSTASRLPASLRALFAWFGACMLFYGFLIRTPGLHYYTLVPTWALLAAWGWSLAVRWPCGRAARVGVYAAGIVVAALLIYHPVMLFVQAGDEYALNYPLRRNAIYWNTSGGVPDRFFGLPHRSGWKAVGALFDQGSLSGAYRSNEKAEITGWYLGRPPAEDERPDYYLIARNATEKPHRQDYPRELLDSEYGVIGQVTVKGTPTIEIYRRRGGETLGVFEDRILAPRFDIAVGLHRVVQEAP